MITKRLAAPKLWKIPRKVRKFVISPEPGPHTKETSVPLGIVLREYLGVADNVKEIKSALSSGSVKVDGKPRKSHRFPIGIMDILEVAGKHYRVSMSPSGFKLVEISQSDAMKKLLRIKRKVKVKGGKTQYTFHDGRTKILDEDYKTNSTLLVSIPNITVMDYYELKEGNYALITGGNEKGKMGIIKEIKLVRSFMPNRVVVDTGDEQIETVMDYIFVIGKNKPAIEV